MYQRVPRGPLLDLNVLNFCFGCLLYHLVVADSVETKLGQLSRRVVRSRKGRVFKRRPRIHVSNIYAEIWA